MAWLYIVWVNSDILMMILHFAAAEMWYDFFGHVKL